MEPGGRVKVILAWVAIHDICAEESPGCQDKSKYEEKKLPRKLDKSKESHQNKVCEGDTRLSKANH